MQRRLNKEGEVANNATPSKKEISTKRYFSGPARYLMSNFLPSEFLSCLNDILFRIHQNQVDRTDWSEETDRTHGVYLLIDNIVIPWIQSPQKLVKQTLMNSMRALYSLSGYEEFYKDVTAIMKAISEEREEYVINEWWMGLYIKTMDALLKIEASMYSCKLGTESQPN